MQQPAAFLEGNTGRFPFSTAVEVSNVLFSQRFRKLKITTCQRSDSISITMRSRDEPTPQNTFLLTNPPFSKQKTSFPTFSSLA